MQPAFGDVIGDGLAALLVAADDDEAGGAALGEEPRDRLAQPLRAAGDDRDLALELVLHFPPSRASTLPMLRLAAACLRSRARRDPRDTIMAGGKMTRRKLILDVDTGTDDAVAIMLAALHPALELVACTTVNGNVEVEHCTDNTLRVLDHIGRSDIPVYEGLARPLVRPDFPIPRAIEDRAGKIPRQDAAAAGAEARQGRRPARSSS